MRNTFIILLLSILAFGQAESDKPLPENSRVVICGCARNVEEHLPRVFKNCINPLQELFHETRVVIFENDSKDQTLAYLEERQKGDPNLVVLAETKLNQRFKKRTDRLAYARNRCLEYVHSHFSDYDYLIVVDLDNRPVKKKKIDLEAVSHFFDKRNEWDLLSVGKPYYDIWALRSELCPGNCWNREDGEAHVREVRDEMKRILTQMDEGELLEVDSTFNGFAIYYLPKTIGCVYDGKNREDPEYTSSDCEHVAFHKEMREKNGARIVISPRTIF